MSAEQCPASGEEDGRTELEAKQGRRSLGRSERTGAGGWWELGGQWELGGEEVGHGDRKGRLAEALHAAVK